MGDAMRRIVCLFLVLLLSFEDALAEEFMVALVDGVGNFFAANAGSILTVLVVVLLLSIVFLSVVLYVMTLLIEWAYKSRGISLRPSVSTLIALMVFSFISGILSSGLYPPVLIENAVYSALFGLVPAFIVFWVKHARAKRFSGPPETSEASSE